VLVLYLVYSVEIMQKVETFFKLLKTCLLIVTFLIKKVKTCKQYRKQELFTDEAVLTEYTFFLNSEYQLTFK
jgi:hypothetical protein